MLPWQQSYDDRQEWEAKWGSESLLERDDHEKWSNSDKPTWLVDTELEQRPGMFWQQGYLGPFQWS